MSETTDAVCDALEGAYAAHGHDIHAAALSLARDLVAARHQRADVERENTCLRAALASSQSPCVYCQLPAADMAQCRAGFPGCDRADDLSGCPEFGARLQLADVAYLEAWMRGDNARIHWDAFSGAYFADGHPEDGADSLPALGALLRQREGGR